MTKRAALLALADRCEAGEQGNSLDVLIEVALRNEGHILTNPRANNAGTKVVYTDYYGNKVTCWAEEWTRKDLRASTAAALRALAEEIE